MTPSCQFRAKLSCLALGTGFAMSISGNNPEQPFNLTDMTKKLKKADIIAAVEKFGKYGTLYAPSVSNDWNAEIKSVYYNKQNGSLWFGVYVQGGNTDTDTSVSYEDFVSDGVYRGVTENHGFRYTLTKEQRDEFMKGLAETIKKLWDYENNTPKDVKELEARKREVGGYKFINPAVDKLYDRLNLRHSNYMYKPCRKYDLYKASERGLYKYINEHLDEIARMTDDEVHALYWEVIWNEYQSMA